MVRWQWKNWICRLVFPLKIGWCTETPRGPVSNACPWPCSRIINRTRSKVNIALVAHSPQPIASVHPYKNGKNVQQSNHRKKKHTSIYPPHPLSSPSVPCFSAKRQIDDVREAPLRCRQRMEGGPWLCQLQGQGSLAARAVAPPTMGLPELLMGYSVCVCVRVPLDILK